MTTNQKYEFAYNLFKENEDSATYPLAIGVIMAELDMQKQEKVVDNIRAVIDALRDVEKERCNGYGR